AGEHAGGQRAGQLGVEGLHDDVRGHDDVDSRVDRGAERLEVRVEGGRVAADDGQPGVGVDVGVTVAGEVLGRRGDVLRLQTLDLGGGQLGDEVGVRTRGAQTDDGVGGVGVEVRDGCEVDVHPHRGELRAEHLTLGAGEVRVGGG